MKVICIDDKGRPDEIPTTKWVKKGEPYTVIDIIRCNMQPGTPVALVLEEIDLNGCGFYKGFGSHRFVPADVKPEIVAEEALAL